MKRLGLTDARQVKRNKKTHKGLILEDKNTIIPWQRLRAP
jgi:hypothetical protein